MWLSFSRCIKHLALHARQEQERHEVEGHGQSEPTSSPVPEETQRSSSPEEELSNPDR